jgi:hypothetical protein
LILRERGLTARQARKAVRGVFDLLTGALMRGEEVECGPCILETCYSQATAERVFRFRSGALNTADGTVRPVPPRVIKYQPIYVASTPTLQFTQDPLTGEEDVETVRVCRGDRLRRSPVGGRPTLFGKGQR